MVLAQLRRRFALGSSRRRRNRQHRGCGYGQIEVLEDRALLAVCICHNLHHDADSEFDDDHGGGDFEHESHGSEDGLVEELSGSDGRLEDDGVSGGPESGPNIEVTSVHVRDGAGNEITSPLLGQRVAIRVRYTMTDIPANSSYRIAFTVDGVTRSATTSQGSANNGNWSWWRSGWYASAGLHNVTVTVDADNTVAETDESDNTASFSFTPVEPSLPEKLIWPVEGTPFVESTVSNYLDVDPLSGVADYTGGPEAYNGHSAWDIAATDFSAQDEGLEIYAAAAGTITEINDGEFDRQIAWLDPAPTANYVKIDHGSGWETIYWHLRRDSVTVNVGDSVVAGDTIGYMGSSGISTGSHVHFGVRHLGFSVEPMYAPASYLVDSLPYVATVTNLMVGNVTNYNPSEHQRERASSVEVWKQRSSQVAYVYGIMSGIEQGDVLRYIWRQPDGSVFTTTSSTMTRSYGKFWWWWSRTLPTTPQLGTWTIEYHLNGVKFGERTFAMTSTGQQEVRIEDETDNLILNGRHTPVDFGTATQGGSPLQRTFDVINHGETPLTIDSNIVVPAGFAVVAAPQTVIQPGASSPLTVRLLATAAGRYAGQIRIRTSDADEGEYEFSVEGLIEAPSTGTLTLGISERQLAEGGRTVANVRRTGPTTSALTVQLSKLSNGSLAAEPSGVTIPAGSDYVSFFIDAVDNSALTGTNTVDYKATATGLAPAYNELVITDNDFPGYAVSETGAGTDVTEGGASDSFSVALTVAPPSPVVVMVQNLFPDQITLSATTLTFTPANWDLTQSVDVSAVDDAIADGTQSATVVLQIDDANSDDNFDLLNNHTLSVTVVDDEVAAFQLTESDGTTVVSEDGTTDDLSVVLAAQPAGEVVFNVSSNDLTEVTVSPASLTFTPLSWSTPQVVTVSGPADFEDDGDQTSTVTISVAASSAAAFRSLPSQAATVTTINDNSLSLDIDRNGLADAATDGILIIRHLFEFTGDTLTNNAIGAGAANSTAASIEGTLTASSAMFDVDGNGVRDAATDGILIIRYLFEFTGTALISDSIGVGATRTTGQQVADFLANFMPPSGGGQLGGDGSTGGDSGISWSVDSQQRVTINWIAADGASSYLMTITGPIGEQVESTTVSHTSYKSAVSLGPGQYRIWISALSSNGLTLKVMYLDFKID